MIAATLLCVPPAVRAQTVEAWKPPTLTTERYDEDWSTLADPANSSGRWTERFKYIPLDADGISYLTTGVEFRLRSEKYDDNLWGSAEAPDDGYLWVRALPYADLHAGKLRAFVQPIVAYATGMRPSAGPVDETRVDLLQGFADIEAELGSGATLRLRAGRELMGLGSERLVGTRYGPNVPLAFDGGRAMLHRDSVMLNLFYVRPVEAQAGSFDDRTSEGRVLWGAYATRMSGGQGLDLYYLGYRNREAHFDQGVGREVRHTLGLRAFGTKQDWHWNLEGIYQFGRFAGAPINGWSVATEIGHEFVDAPFAPDVTVRMNIVSGDHDPTDGRLQTFNPLFPKGKYFGELSPVGPYNIINIHPGVELDLGDNVTFGIVGMAYWRQRRSDGTYDIAGQLLRSGRGSDARFIGKEVEATFSWLATPELELSTSFSVFAPGAFIRDTGPARTIRMIGLEANFRF